MTKSGLIAFLVVLAMAANLHADGGSNLAKRQAIMEAIISGDRGLAFRSMDQALPYRVVAKGGAIAELPRAARKLEVSYQFNGDTHSLDDLLARTRTLGFLVISGGSIVDERYFDGANDKSKFTSWSAAKSVTSTLVGLAVADGKIASVNDPVTTYLPELKGTAYEDVPIKDILEMSSGVAFTEEENNRTSDIWKMFFGTLVTQSQSFSEYVKTLRRRSEAPGAKWVYRSVDTEVLGMLANRVMNQPLSEILAKRIWQPAGMEQDATWITDGSGAEAAFCCLNATLRDYGRFGLLMLHRGKMGNRQIVPEKWISDATNPQGEQVTYGHLWPFLSDDSTGYGYQWWLPNGGEKHPYSAIGLYYQFIYVNPELDLVIAKASAGPERFSIPGQNEQFAAFDAIGRFLQAH